MTRTRLLRLILVLCIAGFVVALGALGWRQWQSYESTSVESVGQRPTASASAAPVVTPSPSGAPSTTPSVEASPDLYAVPRRVRVPAIDVSTSIVPVALDENDALEVPDDIRIVGWYELGVPPGADRGSAVLVAHRDGREQGRGVFYRLGELSPGDRVFVRDDAGESLEYRVVSRESILKKKLPYDELFAVDGPPRLTLISCGGYYDPGNGGYQDNVVVVAVPAKQDVTSD